MGFEWIRAQVAWSIDGGDRTLVGLDASLEDEDRAKAERVGAADVQSRSTNVIEVGEWDERKIDTYTEGTSKTSVRLRMKMYAADGTLLWAAKSQKVEESQYYNPELYRKATQTGQVVYDETKVPSPPPIQPVAIELAGEVVDTLPDVSPAEADSSGG